MRTYFIKQKGNESYVGTIYRTSISTYSDRNDALEFSTLEMAKQFLNKVQDIQTATTFEKAKWTIYIRQTTVEEVV